MEQPKVLFKPDSFAEIHAVNPVKYTTTDVIRKDISAAIAEAEAAAGLALDVLLDTVRPRDIRDKRQAWDSNPTIVTYLGKSPTLASEIKSAVYRMATVYRRLKENQLRVRLLPQHRGFLGDAAGHNYGGSFSPNTFVLFPRWFDDTDPFTIIHELFHEWYADFKVGPRGNRRTAYGAADAKQLARQHPARARRNPENFEHFCRAVKAATPGKRIPKAPDPVTKGISKGVNKGVAPAKVIRGVRTQVTKGVRKVIKKATSGTTRSPQPRMKTSTRGPRSRPDLVQSPSSLDPRPRTQASTKAPRAPAREPGARTEGHPDN